LVARIICATMLGMKTQVLTVIGPDRPGIVAELSKVIAEHGGNWLDSRMANLAGQFAGIVELSVESAKAEALQASLERLQTQDLHITILNSVSDQNVGQRHLEIGLLGRDHTGIVHDVTRALARVGATIQTMQPQCFSGSMSGGDMFKAQISVAVSTHTEFDELEESLHQVSNDLMVDVLIEEPRV